MAGLSVALPLAKAGFEVTLVERSNRLGGRASSFVSPRLGMSVDVGQHVLLGCCTNLLDFYNRIGALGHIRFTSSMMFAGTTQLDELKPSSLPEPLHMMPLLLRLSQLSLLDKLKAGGLIRGALSEPKEGMTAMEWLLSVGQSKKSISGFWEPILIGALNDTPDRVSARYAAMVVRQAMIINRDGVRLGIPAVPLSVLHDELPRKVLQAFGVTTCTGTSVSGLSVDQDKAAHVALSDGSEIEADYFVIAADPSSLDLVPQEFVVTSSGASADMSPSQVPIITLYLWFKEKIEVPEALCVAGKHFHWSLNRSGFDHNLPGMSTAISLVASAARDLASMSDDDVLSVGLGELQAALRSQLPKPDEWMVVRHLNATFSPSIDADKVRPLQKTMVGNLFLAGDWTDTGWPGTMEGAVRSGYACAREILLREGESSDVPLPDLPAKGLINKLRWGRKLVH